MLAVVPSLVDVSPEAFWVMPAYLPAKPRRARSRPWPLMGGANFKESRFSPKLGGGGNARRKYTINQIKIGKISTRKTGLSNGAASSLGISTLPPIAETIGCKIRCRKSRKGALAFFVFLKTCPGGGVFKNLRGGGGVVSAVPWWESTRGGNKKYTHRAYQHLCPLVVPPFIGMRIHCKKTEFQQQIYIFQSTKKTLGVCER